MVVTFPSRTVTLLSNNCNALASALSTKLSSRSVIEALTEVISEAIAEFCVRAVSALFTADVAKLSLAIKRVSSAVVLLALAVVAVTLACRPERTFANAASLAIL